MGYINTNGDYHEGDPRPGDTKVPSRPSPLHEWIDSAWKLSLPTAKTSKFDDLKSNYQAEIERPIQSSALGSAHEYGHHQLMSIVMAKLSDTGARILCTDDKGVESVKDHTSFDIKRLSLDINTVLSAHGNKLFDLFAQLDSIAATGSVTEQQAVDQVQALIW